MAWINTQLHLLLEPEVLIDGFIAEGEVLKDTIAPLLERIDVLSAQELKLTFSEILEVSSAVNVENYTVNNTIGNPESATLDSLNKSITLIFKKLFPTDASSTLTVTRISDGAGNVIKETFKEFYFYQARSVGYKDIIITEIFADPSPSIGLPESEFVEIFNRSETAFNLSGWKFTDQNSVAVFPDFLLRPKSYLILTSQNSNFGDNTLALSNFPSLNNASDVLVLKNTNEITIDSVKYADDWYQDEDKKNGGWSLELIDLTNLCSEKQNWVASENPSGGTPGIQNSVFAEKPDLTGPKLLSVIPAGATSVVLKFDEKLEKKLPAYSSITITPANGVFDLSFSNSSLTELQIFLTQTLQPSVLYTLAVTGIYDCTGNLIQPEFSSITFGLAENADSLDIVMNEILFNPRPTGVDFLELVNNSEKFINLKNWSIANEENGVLKDASAITDTDLLVKPGDYLALTESPSSLKSEYVLSDENTFLPVKKLPPFSDEQGSVVLFDDKGKRIDHFAYNKTMHSAFIKDNEGVSLERISLNPDVSAYQNWKSASSTVGFATPGYLNSNAAQDPSLNDDAVKVIPEIFNPDSGQPNFIQIHYNFDKGGYVASVKIFNPQGHLVKQLANNDVLGTKGFYRWDGDREDGSKARVGYYMIWFEVFDDVGTVMKYQKRVAIAAMF